MRSVRDLGLLDKEEVPVGSDSVVPRDVFISVVSPHLTRPEDPDLVALRVIATGTKDGARVTHTWNLLDKKDEINGITSMMRTTGYTLSIVGLLMGRDVISETGVFPADEGIPEGPYLEELAQRGIDVQHSMTVEEPTVQPAG
jgi:lysine 6-dehydrogenase